MFATATETQFYPSTEYLANKICYQANIKAKMTVCDPTAGNGMLLDAVAKDVGSHYHAPKCYAIEIDPELRYILQGKGHKVVGTDFLAYSEPLKFDRVIMNPPFKNGAEMVLKAWNNHLKDNGVLVAILNAETLRNPFSKERQALVGLIEQYGSQQDLGQAFKHAARPTEVEVYMITLAKPKLEQEFTFAAANFSHDSVSAEEFSANPLAHTNKIKNLAAKYKACEATLIERFETQSKLNYYLEGVSRSIYNINEKRDLENINLCSKEDLLDQVNELKSRFWNTVFEMTELSKKATSGFKQKFQEYSVSQASMEFNEQNITEMLEMFFLNREQIMDDCLVEVFDKATSYHEKNCIHQEGWKTNKSYKLNKRIIHPNGVEWCKIMEDLSVSRYPYNFLNDLDKVLCWLSGKSIDNPDFVGTYSAIDNFCKTEGRIDHTQSFESTFFKIRVYKKGTMHLDFLDQKLLEQFNIAAAKGKKWIGADY